jgi:hypothetical protein
MPTLRIFRAGDKPDTSNWKQGFVYVVKPVHANVYKIGETDNLERRLDQLKKKFDFDLEYVFTHPSNMCLPIHPIIALDWSNAYT